MELKYRVKKARKGIVGIEAAIVLIAFVIVAAALAFVVLNMGFTTTQKSKETMSSGLAEASSALEIDGSVLARTSNSKVVLVAIPLKLAPGKAPIDMAKAAVSIVFYDGSSWQTQTVNLDSNKIYTTSESPVTNVTSYSLSGSVDATLHFYMGDDDNIFESGDKAILYVELDNGAPPYAKIHIEIKPPVGAPLTIERTVPPNLSDVIVMLG